ncbi:hypothetical protein AGMMS49965_19730 [Bacteroidia bacterium]|nr:hypothetical protein AGMMS49965_19730 [Bacteroidia bacterium]
MRYNPNKQFNPVVQAQKLEKLKVDIKALSKSNDNHIAYLADFTRHDIKNAILSMDSILTVTTPEEFTQEKIASLSTYLEVISNTIENFAKLVPYSSDGKFKLETLFVAIEVLTRSDMQNP